jgi:superfamily II DNA or RNA helicase
MRLRFVARIPSHRPSAANSATTDRRRENPHRRRDRFGSLSKERHAIFVVPRLSLIEQTVAAFEREGIWNIGVLQGRHFRTNLTAPVQIASAQTLVRRDIPSADIVIVDECHLQFEKINKWIASPAWSAVPFVGLSATPWSRGLGKTYDDLLWPVSIQELIAEGYLSPLRVFAPPAPDLTGVRTVAGEFHEGDLSNACNTKEIVADVVTTWLEKGENRPTLCYGIDRKHAQHLQERFIEAGVRAEYIDCDTRLFDREEIFDRFRASETKLICNVATLDTGIDLDVRCIIDARPTKSRIRFVQTIGRGLRPSPGKDHLIVLDHAGRLEHMAHVGLENGRLKVTWLDFEKFGVGRRFIPGALAEVIAAGIVAITQPGRKAWGRDQGAPTQYRLTYLPVAEPGDFRPPTNEWKSFSAAKAPKASTHSSNGKDKAKHQAWARPP